MENGMKCSLRRELEQDHVAPEDDNDPLSNDSRTWPGSRPHIDILSLTPDKILMCVLMVTIGTFKT